MRLERHGDVIELVWAAPKLNVFTAAVADELESALDNVPDDCLALIFRAELAVVDRLVPGAELLPRARGFMAKPAAGPTAASAVAKRILRAARDQGSRRRTASLRNSPAR